MDARIDLTKTARFLSPFHKRPYDKTGPDETADAIAILQAITPSPDCSCAEYIGDGPRCKVHGDLYDKYGEQEQQARECEADAEWLTDVSDLDYLGRLVYGEALGAHTIISGGDVLELGPQNGSSEECPF